MPHSVHLAHHVFNDTQQVKETIRPGPNLLPTDNAPIKHADPIALWRTSPLGENLRPVYLCRTARQCEAQTTSRERSPSPHPGCSISPPFVENTHPARRAGPLRHRGTSHGRQVAGHVPYPTVRRSTSHLYNSIPRAQASRGASRLQTGTPPTLALRFHVEEETNKRSEPRGYFE